MSRLRVVVTLPWTTSLPEDVSVNTFHVLTTSSPPSAGELSEIYTNFSAFYNSDFGAGGDPLSQYIGSLVSRAAAACTVEVFDLADAEPRIAIDSNTFTLGAASIATMLPPEVALCASYQAEPVSGVPQARRRGRVFIGPLCSVAANSTTGRPATAFVTALKDASKGISDLFVGSGVAWTVYSRTGDAMAAISNGWVDDEWDTMRSRGRLRTLRNTWVA